MTDLPTLRRHFAGATAELHALKTEAARVTSCLESLRESTAKTCIRDVLAVMERQVRSAQANVTRRRYELERAEGVPF